MPLYTLQYVYAASDFTTAPPGESGADAAGTPPFTVVTAATAAPQTVVVNDTNATRPQFDEVNNSGQTLSTGVTIGSTFYPAGTPIYVNYRITTATGLNLYSISITTTGNNGNNVTDAWVSDDPLQPGTSYTFTSEANIGGGNVTYASLACFAAGTLILTPDGQRPVETLVAGDFVCTIDHGPQPLRWAAGTTVDGTDPRNAPIRFAPGAIGNATALFVSPNHRVLAGGAAVELHFAEAEVLVPAKSLVNGDSIRPEPCAKVTYWHLMFDRHEVIWSNGAATESFFLGGAEDSGAARAVRQELTRLFPRLAENAMVPARPMLRPAEARVLAPSVLAPGVLARAPVPPVNV
jgi:hypothetical protein